MADGMMSPADLAAVTGNDGFWWKHGVLLDICADHPCGWRIWR